MPAHSYSTTATTQTITGLNAGVSYTFTVAAINAVGRGAISAPQRRCSDRPDLALLPAPRRRRVLPRHAARRRGGRSSWRSCAGLPRRNRSTGHRPRARTPYGVRFSPNTRDSADPPGVLGYPITDQITLRTRSVAYTNFRGSGRRLDLLEPGNGSATISTGPSVRSGSALGAEHGPLGYPKLDEAIAPDGVGRQSSFAGAGGPYLYWSPSTGAHEVVGVILAKYRAAGGPKSLLRYPTSDQAHTTRNVGLENHFTLGSIYWSPPTGAHIVPLLYQNAWAALGCGTRLARLSHQRRIRHLRWPAHQLPARLSDVQRVGRRGYRDPLTGLGPSAAAPRVLTPIRSSRARATRERIVPMGQPQIWAVSS